MVLKILVNYYYYINFLIFLGKYFSYLEIGSSISAFSFPIIANLAFLKFQNYYIINFFIGGLLFISGILMLIIPKPINKF